MKPLPIGTQGKILVVANAPNLGAILLANPLYQAPVCVLVGTGSYAPINCIPRYPPWGNEWGRVGN